MTAFHSVRRFLRLPTRRLVIEACLELILAWIIVRRRPFRKWAGYLDNSAYRSGPLDRRQLREASAAARCVNAISARLGGRITCLMKAIAVRRMLWRRGIGSAINIGVNRPASDSSSSYGAHAWLDAGGFTLTGQEEKSAFTAILGEGRSAAESRTGKPE